LLAGNANIIIEIEVEGLVFRQAAFWDFSYIHTRCQ